MKNKNKKCSVYGCKKDSFAKGMCRLHYARVRRSGITKLIRKIVNYNSDTHGEKNKYHNRGYIDKHICTDCGILLTKKNTYRNAFKHKQYRCKVCTRKRSRDFHRIHLIGVSGGRPLRLKDKLPHHPDNNKCMLCNRPPTRRTGLCYHHWVIIDGVAYGIWLCCVCHMFAERYDHDYTPKYIKLKEKILRNTKGGINVKGRDTT